MVVAFTAAVVADVVHEVDVLEVVLLVVELEFPEDALED
jgi:hypothetical protein